MQARTVNEAAAFTGLDARVIWKDLEQGVITAGSPPRLSEDALVYLRARATFAFSLAARDRQLLFARISDAVQRRVAQLDLGTGWRVDVAAITRELRDRIDRFEAWRATIQERAEVIGGEPTFAGTRLSVRHIGDQQLRGAATSELAQDYPYLSEQDLEFARLYALAYPRVGRPSRRRVAG